MLGEQILVKESTNNVFGTPRDGLSDKDEIEFELSPPSTNLNFKVFNQIKSPEHKKT